MISKSNVSGSYLGIIFNKRCKENEEGLLVQANFGKYPSYF